MIQLFAAFVALLLYPVIVMVFICSNAAALLVECSECNVQSQLQLILLLTRASLILYILSIVLIGFALLNRQSEIGRMLTTHIVVCIGLFAHVCNLLELNNKSKQLRISISAPILCALCLCFIQKKIFTNQTSFQLDANLSQRINKS